MKKIYFLEGGLGNQAAILAHVLAGPTRENTRISNIKFLTKFERRPYKLNEYFRVKNMEIMIDYKITDIFVYFGLKFLNKLRKQPIEQFTLFNTTYHIGYFQDNMLNNFQHLKPYSKFSPKKKDYLAIHIRRGDYLLPKHGLHGLLCVSSIKKAAIKILEETEINQIQLISEDPDIYLEFFSDERFEQYELIDCTTLAERGVFEIMINCSYLIATNSTFSVLAGVLSEGELWIPQIWDRTRGSDFVGTGANRYNAKFEV